MLFSTFRRFPAPRQHLINPPAVMVLTFFCAERASESHICHSAIWLPGGRGPGQAVNTVPPDTTPPERYTWSWRARQSIVSRRLLALALGGLSSGKFFWPEHRLCAVGGPGGPVTFSSQNNFGQRISTFENNLRDNEIPSFDVLRPPPLAAL